MTMITFNENNILHNVDLKNQEIKNLLTSWSDYIMSIKDDITKHVLQQLPPGRRSNPQQDIDHYMNDEYRQHIIDKGVKHEGYPEVGYYFNLRPNQLQMNEPTAESKEFVEQFSKRYHDFSDQLMALLGVRYNALCAVYPDEGFIGWHNNANAAAYNLIFTFSETGDGYWRHVNPYTKQTEQVNDVPGWQCKATYFGSYKENNPLTLIYHTAKSVSGWRMTVSYIFDTVNKEWWEQTIEEIESA